MGTPIRLETATRQIRLEMKSLWCLDIAQTVPGQHMVQNVWPDQILQEKGIQWPFKYGILSDIASVTSSN